MQEAKYKGAILVLSGPSGAGKSSLCQILAREFPKHYFSISSTTRPKRENEIDGVHYHFVSKDKFEQGIKEDSFLEWAQVHGSYYGTMKSQIIEALYEDKLIILDVDIQGQMNIKRAFPNHTTSVFITTLSQKILKERLSKRGSDNIKVIEERLKNATKEIESLYAFDYLIINDDLEECSKKLICIVKSAFCKASLYHLDSLLQKWQE
ncbi:guanylate kinase [Helicobacter mesocricetorum]|uniref:guanylate kinase n=1 Tax=Helicobacter mesocricetorum TaxID=87012 RepID=UPI000CF0C642|nr:guanylate kinase [Helicobacter mesocricetorum]